MDGSLLDLICAVPPRCASNVARGGMSEPHLGVKGTKDSKSEEWGKKWEKAWCWYNWSRWGGWIIYPRMEMNSSAKAKRSAAREEWSRWEHLKPLRKQNGRQKHLQQHIMTAGFQVKWGLFIFADINPRVWVQQNHPTLQKMIDFRSQTKFSQTNELKKIKYLRCALANILCYRKQLASPSTVGFVETMSDLFMKVN